MKGICFKEPLFHAVVEGSKTMTRRLFKPTANFSPTNLRLNEPGYQDEKDNVYFPYYKVGETVYLKEPYSYEYDDETNKWKPFYKYDGFFCYGEDGPVKYKNKLFMPESAARHFIRITSVRAERLQDISEEDCLREGVYKGKCGTESTHTMTAYYFPNDNQPHCTAREVFAMLIDKISGKGTWESNPWVWVYEFELIK